jgi:WD40 repeat protein
VSQVHLQSYSGGEARQLTRHETAVTSITWSPGGDSICFLASDPKTAEEREKDRLRGDVLVFDENYKQSHLWKAALADEKDQRITQGDFSTHMTSTENGREK